MANNFLPVSNKMGSLGSPDRQWNTVYAETIVVSSSIQVPSQTVNSIQFYTEAFTPTRSVGQMYWDNTEKTINVDMAGSNVSLQLGQEILLYARNTSGIMIQNGSAVRISGAQGNKITIEKAIAKTGSFDNHLQNEIIGVATEDIPNNSLGYVCTFGAVRGLNTTAYNEGDTLYLSHASLGGFITTRPPAPYDVIQVGVVERVNDSEGQIYVNTKTSTHFTDITGVTGSNVPIGYSYLRYNSDTKVYEFTRNFTGSFVGDGSGLTGVTVTSTPAGSSSYVQFNRNGETGGSPNFQFDFTNNVHALNSGVKNKTVHITSSTYNVLKDDYRIGIKYTQTGSVDVYLPDTNTVQGQEYTFKDEGGNATVNNIIIHASGSQTIDGQPNVIIAVSYTSIKIYNDNQNWFIE